MIHIVVFAEELTRLLIYDIFIGERRRERGSREEKGGGSKIERGERGWVGEGRRE